MEPWEVMVSESQERMVAIVRPTMVEAVGAVLDRWELSHASIGEVTATGVLRAFWHGDSVGEIPARLLTEECPRYELRCEPRPRASVREIVDDPAPAEALLQLLAAPNVRSREFVFRRYDQLVGSRTIRRPGFGATVLRLRPSLRGLAIALDGQGRIARLDPFLGGALAVFEATRGVACTGGEPLGVTDCLNFGNPEKPEIAWELVEAIEGMARACEILGIPVVSGNVSLYNETDGRSIHPTPVVGCVGVVADVRAVPGAWRAGDVVLVAGGGPVSLDGSEYQARFLGGPAGRPPQPDYVVEAGLVRFLWRSAPLLSAAHDVSDGGLAVALAELALHSGVGAEVDLGGDALDWFGEGAGRAVVGCPPERAGALEGVELRRIGVVRGDRILGVALEELREAYEGSPS